MFKLIDLLGKFVVKAYFKKAAGLNKLAQVEAKAATKLAAQSQKALGASQAATAESASVAAKAQSLSKFFA